MVADGATGSSTESPRHRRALDELYTRVPLGMRLGLEPMRAACKAAGHPERTFDVVHIAGTNGKGSTAAMVDSIARAADLRVGLYTSPHLCRFAERIAIDGSELSDDAFTSVLERALEVGRELSFFETATLAAFLAFADAKVDLAVLEVGIGGRLDATNVVPTPRCAAITRVAFDHVDLLGRTLEDIAREKAGIAKPDGPIVLGPLPPEARAAALATITAAGARVVESKTIPRDFPPIGLEGPFQADNARVAWTIAEVLGLDVRARRDGLRSVRWPGRLERLTIPTGRWRGSWLLDGAHNPDGARALVGALSRGPRPRAIVFGAFADKAWPEMLDVFDGFHDATRVYVAPRGRAAADPQALAARRPGSVASSMPEALRLARKAANDGLVVVCGSLHVVGEARALLLELREDPPVAY